MNEENKIAVPCWVFVAFCCALSWVGLSVSIIDDRLVLGFPFAAVSVGSDFSLYGISPLGLFCDITVFGLSTAWFVYTASRYFSGRIPAPSFLLFALGLVGVVTATSAVHFYQCQSWSRVINTLKLAHFPIYLVIPLIVVPIWYKAHAYIATKHDTPSH